MTNWSRTPFKVNYCVFMSINFIKYLSVQLQVKILLQTMLCVLLETRSYLYIAWELRDEQGCWLVLMFCSNCSVGSKSEMECLLYLFIHLFLQHLLLMRRLMMTNDFTCWEDAQTFHAYLDISNDTN